MKSANQVNCSGKTARKGRLYYLKTDKGRVSNFDITARPQKIKPIELVALFKA